MTHQVDDSIQAGKATQSKRQTQGSNSLDTGGAHAAGVHTAQEHSKSPSGNTVVRRKRQYLIGTRSTSGMYGGQSDAFLVRLASMEGVKIVRKIRPRHAEGRPASELFSANEIVVVQVDEDHGEALRQHAPPHVIVELDAPVVNSDLAALEPLGWPLHAHAMPFPRARRDIRFSVLGAGDRPLANASINLFGPGFPTQAVTDMDGLAIVGTYAADTAEIQALYVRPMADHWEHYLQHPMLDVDRLNTVHLRPLTKKSSKSSTTRPHGWGQRLMHFDRLSAEWSGVGVKVGLIDSGCDNSHPNLRHVVHGADLTSDHDSDGWRADSLGHGTHCAGIIAAAAVPGSELIGCAPGCELHVVKVAPGGHCSNLIEALDLCIAQRLDIVQIGVYAEHFSELVAQKLGEVQAAGIACIMGAGNTGGPVQFPANMPGVLTVGAVGKLGEFRSETRHAQRALPPLVPGSGLFATYFSCWGPQVAVCAPGVAIVSSVPGGGYAAWDGSAIAASHITGLAAMLMSRHADLQLNRFAGRLVQRASLLSELIRSAAVPLDQVDPNRIGFGLPELERVPSTAISRPFHEYGGMTDSLLVGLSPFLHDREAAALRLRAAGLWA